MVLYHCLSFRRYELETNYSFFFTFISIVTVRSIWHNSVADFFYVLQICDSCGDIVHITTEV